MSSPTSKLSMEKTTPGTSAGWASDLGMALDTLDVLSAGSRVFYVDKGFTASALGNGDAANRRHFDTIQGAIDVAQGSGYSNKNVILITPDNYNERLTIGKTIALCGIVPVNYYGMGAGRGVELRGDGTQNPTITITPPAGGDIAVNLINLNVDNAYSAQATYINKPYAIDWRNDNAVSLVNYLGIHGCTFRCQTWGDDNDWECALSLAGFLRTTINGTDIACMNYAGGNANGGIRKVLKLRGVYTGVPANDKTSWVQIRRMSTIQQFYSGAGASAIMDNDRGTGGRFTRSDVYYNTGSMVVYGSTGINSMIEGLGLDFQSMHNIQAQTVTL